ncbi:MAG: hypothetical protein L3J47_02890 [Sulfurovum sp.]|nr:hypothetical protein [Sulfurovum sp.]
MNRHNFIGVTLFVSILVFNPAVAQTTEEARIPYTLKQTQVLSEQIASALYDKGLEAEAAQKIAKTFTATKEHELAQKVQVFVDHCTEITHEQVLAYLANEALHRNTVSLARYDELLQIYSKITQRTAPKDIQAQLQKIAALNSQAFG